MMVIILEYSETIVGLVLALKVSPQTFGVKLPARVDRNSLSGPNVSAMSPQSLASIPG